MNEEDTFWATGGSDSCDEDDTIMVNRKRYNELLRKESNSQMEIGTINKQLIEVIRELDTSKRMGAYYLNLLHKTRKQYLNYLSRVNNQPWWKRILNYKP